MVQKCQNEKEIWITVALVCIICITVLGIYSEIARYCPNLG